MKTGKTSTAPVHAVVMPDGVEKWRLWNFRNAMKELLALKRDMFPVPCVVWVYSDSFQGHGIVWKEHDEELADSLLVLVSSGNTWAYPMEDCRRDDDRTKWPKWIKDDFKERGI